MFEMTNRARRGFLAVVLVAFVLATPAAAQTVETAGVAGAGMTVPSGEARKVFVISIVNTQDPTCYEQGFELDAENLIAALEEAGQQGPHNIPKYPRGGA